jgi:hypothetical protein
MIDSTKNKKIEKKKTKRKVEENNKSTAPLPLSKAQMRKINTRKIV